MLFTLEHFWYASDRWALPFLLTPFSQLFRFFVYVRRQFYFYGIKKTYRAPVPVIVIGNLTVGGTGKTPFVIWLAAFLRAERFHPGIVSRGVGGCKWRKPHIVSLHDAAHEVGDEALLIVRQTHCPLVIGIHRAEVAQFLLSHYSCDILLSDDGLQHYALGRDIEIAIVDGVRQFGNGRLLPSGPLREPIERLNSVDMVLTHGSKGVFNMQLQPKRFVSLLNAEQTINFLHFPHKKIHAVAGIGHPDRFYSMLKKHGFELVEHRFPDHYLYQAKDFQFRDALPIVMTEKDAVKCFSFADDRFWYLKVETEVCAEFGPQLLEKVQKHVEALQI